MCKCYVKLGMWFEMVAGRQIPGVGRQRQSAQHLAARGGTALLSATVPILLQVSHLISKVSNF